MTAPALVSPKGEDPVIVEGVFEATPERVFAAWTDADALQAWFGRSVRPDNVISDPRIGGEWRVEFTATDGRRNALFGEYLEVDPGRRLVFSWQHECRYPDGSVERTDVSKVTVRFEALDERTRLTLTHEAIVRTEGRLGVTAGWMESLQKLTEHLAASQGGT